MKSVSLNSNKLSPDIGCIPDPLSMTTTCFTLKRNIILQKNPALRSAHKIKHHK